MKRLIFLAWSVVTASAQADDINQRTGLPPEAQVKIGKVVAESYIRGQSALSQTDEVLSQVTRGNNSNGAGTTQSINNVSNVRPGQTPKEVITYAPDGIYNICFHCQ